LLGFLSRSQVELLLGRRNFKHVYAISLTDIDIPVRNSQIGGLMGLQIHVAVAIRQKKSMQRPLRPHTGCGAHEFNFPTSEEILLDAIINFACGRRGTRTTHQSRVNT
jgi:hypothetical protein